VYPFWSQFMACKGCSGNVLFPSHHMGKECYSHISIIVAQSSLNSSGGTEIYQVSCSSE